MNKWAKQMEKSKNEFNEIKSKDIKLVDILFNTSQNYNDGEFEYITNNVNAKISWKDNFDKKIKIGRFDGFDKKVLTTLYAMTKVFGNKITNKALTNAVCDKKIDRDGVDMDEYYQVKFSVKKMSIFDFSLTYQLNDGSKMTTTHRLTCANSQCSRYSDGTEIWVWETHFDEDNYSLALDIDSLIDKYKAIKDYADMNAITGNLPNFFEEILGL